MSIRDEAIDQGPRQLINVITVAYLTTFGVALAIDSKMATVLFNLFRKEALTVGSIKPLWGIPQQFKALTVEKKGLDIF